MNKSGNNRSGHDSKKQGAVESKPYLGAPYNFVSLNEKVFEAYQSMDQLPPHNKIGKEEDGWLSGEIEYRVTAKSKLYIGTSKGFYKNLNKKQIIPANTMRGLTRSNLQILSFSAIGDDVEDQRFMYREVANPKSKIGEDYNKILDPGSIFIGKYRYSYPKRVKAGYIKKENGKYIIFPAKESNRRETYHRRKMTSDDVQVPFIKRKITFEFSKGGLTVDDREGNKKYKNSGTLLCSGRMGSVDKDASEEVKEKQEKAAKKVQYVVREMDQAAKGMELSDDLIKIYQADFSARRNQLNDDSEILKHHRLPADNDVKPVFYIQGENHKILNFGFTPFMRIPYKYSVHRGLPIAHRSDKYMIDYSRALFGFSNGTASYKSRLKFFDAVINENKEEKKSELVLLGPKPKNYLDYIKDNNTNAIEKFSYSSEKFQIRGVKQYWNHKREEDIIYKKEKSDQKETKGDTIVSTLKPIEKGAVFTGKIQFQNLKKEELGLLLWSIRLNDDSLQNVGQGKPYGYGKIKVELDKVYIYDIESLYSLNNLDSDYLKEVDQNEILEYITAYKTMMNEENSYLQETGIDNAISIQEFFVMKSERQIPESKDIRYMEIERKQDNGQKVNEFTKRKKGIPTPLDVVKKNKKR